MNDYETLYLLRQIVQFSPELATRINETLPKTKEQCPASNNLDVAILFSCDKDYFEQKFLTFIAPVLRAQPRVENVYLHLMDGDHNHPSLLELQAQGLTILEDRYELKIDETIRDRIPDAFKEHCRRTWYACARFGVALRLLDVHAKVVILDVDLNITESIESIQGWYGKRSFDVAVRKPKRHRASGVDYWLHESAYAATTKGKQFLATLSVYLDQLMRSGLAFWTLDQCSFNSVIRSKFCENLKVLNLPSGNEVGAHQLTFHRGHNDEHVKGA
jgi:hypothetical protein